MLDSVTVSLRKLDPNVVMYKNMGKYQSLKSSCFYSHRAAAERNFEKDMKEISEHLTRWQAPALLDHMCCGDPGLILDLALRYLSGCGVRVQSSEGALYVLDGFFDPSDEHSVYVGDRASHEMMAQAHSLAAEAHYSKFLVSRSDRAAIEADEKRFARPEAMRMGTGLSPLAYFMLAAQHADDSVNLGLVSPVVLVIGFKLHDIAETLGVDVQKRYGSLWRAAARRLEEVYAEERKRQRKIDKHPNAYVCAAEGCGLRGARKAVLRACGGRCPPDLKPSYCSPECQRKDWPNHKAICKPGSGRKGPKISEEDKAEALALFRIGDPKTGDARKGKQEEPTEEIDTHTGEDGSDWAPRGPGRIINTHSPGAPSGPIQITSSTMDPEFMRSFEDAVSKTVLKAER
ncbi:uncharacterized protein B0H18DRAFT_365820 [Fomitopsis serialis]|uniref:uncharacterized protein n=1 Tax=Fomitopsis serialis TaxID=139415 RepID=UPI002007999F|nr:uncharacterized protein B0H18DRAFT_365820 [Neoantrodia serialis]KAH9925752.1 hypothetical protein B0H18DRAFT_365820 [Neoantrodia serialis]